jgi:hypothetical protein
MGVPTSEVGYTSPQPECRPRSSGEHVVALEKRKKEKKFLDSKEEDVRS